jgi:hypothetical protein
MRDEDFEIFIEEFGEASSSIQVPPEAIDNWKGKLPDSLLNYWVTEGWSCYAQGLFWTVNPSIYDRVLREWIKNTPLDKIDKFHVIARTAFGKLYLWGEKTGDSVSILPHTHAILCLPSDLKRVVTDSSFDLQCFFSNRNKRSCDLKDTSKKPLFDRLIKKLGALNHNEVYGFKHALALGGSAELDNIEKFEFIDYLGFLRQLEEPTFPMADISLEKLR